MEPPEGSTYSLLPALVGQHTLSSLRAAASAASAANAGCDGEKRGGEEEHGESDEESEDEDEDSVEESKEEASDEESSEEEEGGHAGAVGARARMPLPAVQQLMQLALSESAGPRALRSLLPWSTACPP